MHIIMLYSCGVLFCPLIWGSLFKGPRSINHGLPPFTRLALVKNIMPKLSKVRSTPSKHITTTTILWISPSRASALSLKWWRMGWGYKDRGYSWMQLGEDNRIHPQKSCLRNQIVCPLWSVTWSDSHLLRLSAWVPTLYGHKRCRYKIYYF